jgi:hypothetical protein
LNSALRAKMDQVLDGLGDVPVNLGQLIERHIGQKRVTPSEADSLLRELGGGELNRGESLRGSLRGALRGESLRDGLKELGGEPNRGELQEFPDIDRGQEKDGQEKDADRRQLVAGSSQPEYPPFGESTSAKARPEDRLPVVTPAVTGAPLGSTLGLAQNTGSSVSPSVDVRDLRSAPNLRKTAFTEGLTGLDDLPEFPVGRSPSGARPTGESKHSPKPVQSVPDEDTDSFEILVDEEILEFEAEDSVVEDSDDDA